VFTRRHTGIVIGVAALLAVALAVTFWHRRPPAPAAAATISPPVVPTAVPQAPTLSGTEAFRPRLDAILAAHRQIIVLLADQDTLGAAELQSAITAGQQLFHEKLDGEASLTLALDALVKSGRADRNQVAEGVLDHVESAPGLFDADRLAFIEVLSGLRSSLLADSSLAAIKLHKRVGEDLAALEEIEQRYDAELKRIYGRVDTRAIVAKRERWEDYIAHLRSIYTRAAILKEQGVITPYAVLSREDGDGEIFGYGLPPKTVALSFDDGPHQRYTDEIAAILEQYGAPAVFFTVGRNVGSVDGKGKVTLGRNAEVIRRLVAKGHVLGNHSYSHAQLAKQTGDSLRREINDADQVLRAVDAQRAPLFRFPYGAHTAEALQLLNAEHLQSVMWNIDSLDWADPVPASIADRVMRSIAKEGRGIVLFHDIHERTVKALPLVLERLVAEGYRFASWDGKTFTAQREAPAPAAPRQVLAPGYGDSWAVIIGINDYAKWPKLNHAVNDAQAVRKLLVEKFSFAPERVLLLQDGAATRNGILAAFHDKLFAGGMKKDDRVFVFYAGHGATRRLSSGRDVGYLIPADADPDNTATDAIPMTEIQNIAESLEARHVLFVMDACYSGLGLTRGGGGFLRENAKRIGRQMLTAGGADQLVADSGPNGHSVFTWTLLQALNGRADLNGDGLVTATEMAAYVAPAVASVSEQTPAFGSLPGSQGGDFIFELPVAEEFLSADSTQLSGEAIALNSKLADAAPTGGGTKVMVKDLQGKERQLVTQTGASGSVRQRAQRANDQGLLFYREKRYVDAEERFTEALKLRPDFALAANNLGFVYFRQNRHAEAARWFERSLKLDPSRAVAYLNLGDAFAQAGDDKRAREAWRTYLALLPSGPAAERVRQSLAGA
jgi:peptidoglycan/xylan/chitin deacetylase (PgdA/CDA1 family)/uncharacterized caspase-like protein